MSETSGAPGRLRGLDWFEVWRDWPPADGAWYPLPGEYATEAEAHAAATARLRELEETLQPGSGDA